MPLLKLVNSYLKEDKGLKLMMFIAHGLKYFFGYLRTPLLVHYHSIYIYILNDNGIANYADDNTPYSTGTRIHNISDLEQASDFLSK